MSKPKYDTITVIRTAGQWKYDRWRKKWFRHFEDKEEAAKVERFDATLWQAYARGSFIGPFQSRIKGCKACDAALRALSEPNPLAARVAELEAQLKALTKTTEGMKPLGPMNREEIDAWFAAMKREGYVIE